MYILIRGLQASEIRTNEKLVWRFTIKLGQVVDVNEARLGAGVALGTIEHDRTVVDGIAEPVWRSDDCKLTLY